MMEMKGTLSRSQARLLKATSEGGAVKRDEMEGRPWFWWGSKGLVWAPRQRRRCVGGL